MIKLISRLRPDIGFREVMAGLLPGRAKVPEFESRFAKKFENRFGIMFQHGRSGLYTFFKSLEIENLEIICPAYTCVVVPHAVVLSGNVPVFVDCEPGSPNMSIDEIQNSITEKTKAIIVTHLFGYPMDVVRIKQLVKEAEKKFQHKIYIIQDVAHSFGVKWKGELVTKFGDVSLFGLNISKTITTVFGGMITCNDEGIEKKLRAYRDKNFKRKSMVQNMGRLIYLKSIWISFNPYLYGIVNLLERKGLLNRFTKYYDEEKVDFPGDWDFLPSSFEAKVGLVQLKKYNKIIERRTRNAQQWIESMDGQDNIKFFPHIEGATYSHCVGKVEDRTEWEEMFRKKGYQLGILIEYSIPEMQSYNKFKRKEYPVALDYSQHMVNFPVWMKKGL